MQAIKWMKKNQLLTGAISVLLLLTVIKFFWTLFAYEMPLGYDVGLYRYLFIKHGEAFPPFILGDVDAWAKGHPLGLFFFSTILIKLGIPVDWLIGWMWNALSVALLCALAFVSGKERGKYVGVFTLLVGLLSIPYFDGFSAMYWKTFFALFFAVFALHLLERKSYWAFVPITLTIVTHNQTGLLLALVILLWWVYTGSNTFNKQWWTFTGLGVLAAAVSYIWYLPVWDETIVAHLDTLLNEQGNNAPAGAFPPAIFYIRNQGLLIVAGIIGLFLSISRKKAIGPWELAALWSGAFVLFQLFFYRRFFLQFDFFLMPFAGYALYVLFTEFKSSLLKFGIIVLIMIQAFFSARVMFERKPDIDAENFQALIHYSQRSNPTNYDSLAIIADNQTAIWFRGWAPNARIGAPGLFNLHWNAQEWATVLFGSNQIRHELLKQVRGPIYFFLMPIFYSHYQDSIQPLLNDPCVIPDGDLPDGRPGVLRVDPKCLRP